MMNRLVRRPRQQGAPQETRELSAQVRVLRGDKPSLPGPSSKQIITDSATSIAFSPASARTPVIPLAPPEYLVTLVSYSSVLPQSIEAYVTNLARYGWEVVESQVGRPMDPKERAVLESFIESPNADQSLTAIHAHVVQWYETVGHSYIEVVRDSSGTPSILRTIENPCTVRVCPMDEEVVRVPYSINRGIRSATVVELKRFRLFIQESNGETVYFKEFGDPRILDCRTGQFYAPGTDSVPLENRATELLMFKQNGPDAVYGGPRWWSLVPELLGSREAAEVNLQYFKDNTVPPMILSVTGGRLTGESFKELKDLLDTDGVGKARQNRILLLEAIAESPSIDDRGTTVGLQVDKLTDSRQSDALFGSYDEANRVKIRSAFRLPPVAIGLSQDVNFATANVSTFVLETQVFAPMRALFDEIYNKKLICGPKGLGLKTVKLRSKAPTVTNPEVVIRSLTALNVMGAVTPRLARNLANQLLQVNLSPYPEFGQDGYEEWMDSPLALTLREVGSGKQDVPDSTHLDQQTKDASVKSIEAGGDVSIPEPENGSE